MKAWTNIQYRPLRTSIQDQLFLTWCPFYFGFISKLTVFPKCTSLFVHFWFCVLVLLMSPLLCFNHTHLFVIAHLICLLPWDQLLLARLSLFTASNLLTLSCVFFSKILPCLWHWWSPLYFVISFCPLTFLLNLCQWKLPCHLYSQIWTLARPMNFPFAFYPACPASGSSIPQLSQVYDL